MSEQWSDNWDAEIWAKPTPEKLLADWHALRAVLMDVKDRTGIAFDGEPHDGTVSQQCYKVLEATRPVSIASGVAGPSEGPYEDGINWGRVKDKARQNEGKLFNRMPIVDEWDAEKGGEG